MKWRQAKKIARWGACNYSQRTRQRFEARMWKSHRRLGWLRAARREMVANGEVVLGGGRPVDCVEYCPNDYSRRECRRGVCNRDHAEAWRPKYGRRK